MSDVKSCNGAVDLGMNEKVKLILGSKRNANLIIDLLENLDGKDKNCVMMAIRCCYKVFSPYVKKRKFTKGAIAPTDTWQDFSSIDSMAVEDVFQGWMHAKYRYFVDRLLKLLASAESSIAEAATEILMDLMIDEYTWSIARTSKVPESAPVNNLRFPNKFYVRIIQALIADHSVDKERIRIFSSKYFQYEDVKFYFLKNLDYLFRRLSKLNKAPNDANSHAVAENVYAMLLQITPRDDVMLNDLFLSQADVDRLNLDCSEINRQYRAVFSAAWFALLKAPGVSSNLRKRFLLHMDTKILPYLVDPKLLMDFLTDWFDAGGATALLALSGLFTLISGYNLDYPDFYIKLYSLYEPTVFAVKHKERFFRLSDLFLSSSHLPAYLVAAFIKRMARLSLFAPLEDVLILLTLMKNLLIRHPSCRVLVHRKVSSTGNFASDKIRDAYVHDEVDPAKCNALASSLWELATLRNHYHADVVKLVDTFKKDFGTAEEDVASRFGFDCGDAIMRTLGADLDERNAPAMNFVKPNALFVDSELGNWRLE